MENVKMNNKRINFANHLLGKRIDQTFRQTLSPSQFSKEIERKKKIDKIKNKQKKKVALKKDPNIEIIPTCCFSCHSTCEVLVFREKDTGKIIKIEGDPNSPVTEGLMCSKGLAAKDLIYNTERIKHPLQRIGKRGEGKWKRISWDDAIEITTNNLKTYRENYGARSIAFLEGTRRGWSRVFSRLANVFGAINHGACGWAQCSWPRRVDNKVTFGKDYIRTADFENTNCMLIWGVNPPSTWPIVASKIMDARERGASLIVVDPYLTETAAKADLWLQLKPGTDTALALSMLNVIIENNLIDKDFIHKWTIGFEELKNHIKQYNADWGEKITGIPANKIIEAAKLFSSLKPSCIYRCVALDELHDSVQACRAVSLLSVITGNIGIPGGNISNSKRGDINQNTLEFICYHLLKKEEIPLRIGFKDYPLLCDEISPVPSAHMPSLWETIETGKPYNIKAGIIFGSNAVVSYSNADYVKKALNKLDFLLVTDLFMTPTAELADIVLPASSWLERDNVISSSGTSPTYTIAQQKVTSVSEARSDVDIICDIAKKLGLKEFFWKDSKDFYNYLLEPTGLSFDEFKKQKRIFSPLQYRQYEKDGFSTPSGKIEIKSSLMKKYNCSPLPGYADTKPNNKDFPYLLTSGRVPVFRHTENRINPYLREIYPEHEILIHPEAARKNNINDGDWIVIETKTGSFKGKAKLTEGLNPEVIRAVPGWKGECNINNAIPWENFAEGIGTVPMRGVPCRVKISDK